MLAMTTAKANYANVLKTKNRFLEKIIQGLDELLGRFISHGSSDSNRDTDNESEASRGNPRAFLFPFSTRDFLAVSLDKVSFIYFAFHLLLMHAIYHVRFGAGIRSGCGCRFMNFGICI